ncbi:MAG: hypothetical protein AB3N16_12145 [Flavobacteriaceae bacterium]
MVLHILTILSCTAIAVQDIKDRMVYWVLFPITGILLGSLYLQHSSLPNFVLNVSTHLLLVAVIIALLWVYTKFLRKQEFLNASFGFGDVLCLIAFALGFPTVTFIVLLASGLCFSVLAFIVLNYFVNAITVPLAGFICLFLIGILLLSNFSAYVSLYAF